MLINPKYQTRKYVRELKDLLVKCEQENNLRIWKRVRSVLLYLNHKRPEEITEILNVGLKSVYRWLNRYNEDQVEGLYEGCHTGRPRGLTEVQLERLEEILDSGPIAYGLTTGVWTCPAIQHLIEEEFGVCYHHDHVRKILHRLGFSVQRPVKKLALAKPELQQKWIRKTYPELKKSAGRRGG